MIIVIIYKRKHNNFHSIIISQDESGVISQKDLKDYNVRVFDPNLFPTPFSHNLSFLGDPICTIDINGFRLGDPVIITPCFHIFHPICINEWLNSIQRERRCPNCNFEMRNIKIHLK